MTEIKDACGHSRRFEYDPMDRVTADTDENGVRRTHEYDAGGNLIKYTDGLGNSEKYVYDKNGNLTGRTDRNGNTMGYTLDGCGNIVTVTDAAGRLVQKDEFDTRRRIMKRCPCCGYLTIDDSEEVITDVCEVCFWQYDEVAHEEPDRIIGANKVSLNVAKANFKSFGAVEKRFITLVRKPYDDEMSSYTADRPDLQSCIHLCIWRALCSRGLC